MAWPFAVFFRAMKAYYEATGDERVPKALERNYLSYSVEELGRNLHSVFERIVAALNAKVHIEVVVANLLNIYNSDMANDYFKFNLGHVS